MVEYERCPRCGTKLDDAESDHCPTCRLRSTSGAASNSPGSSSGDPQPNPVEDTATLLPRDSSFADSAESIGRQLRTFDDYELIEEIARGGMGVVYKARQISLNRIVAVKMILAGEYASDQEVRRFHSEAEAAANLEHSGIVPIYEIGRHSSHHYFSMAYVDGPSLARKLAGGPFTPRSAAHIVKKATDAVAFAHSQGVVHRDLKPANILLEGDNEPRITDFGLAKRVNRDSNLTATGQVLGTPSYMPPEQAAGKQDVVGERSDVYSLGAILYALITGRPPFQADNDLDTLLQVMERDPAPPRLLNPKVDRDLEAICLKCLEKDPKHRYQSAEELLNDLQRYLEGSSISVRSLNVLARTARTLQRSQDDADLRAWGTMLYWFAALVFLGEVGIYLHAVDGPPYPTHWAIAIRATQFTLMGVVLWCFRGRWSISQTAAERQMLAIWIGFFLASNLMIVIAWEMSSAEYPLDELRIYPALAVISGLTLFVMGSRYWGQCFTFGVTFFVLALAMPLNLKWAPLGFGLLWAVCLSVIGTHLRRISGESSGPARAD